MRRNKLHWIEKRDKKKKREEKKIEETVIG